MKTITVSQYEGLIAEIIHDWEDKARLAKEPFTGVPEGLLWEEIKRHIGDDWTLKKDKPFKFTKDDINAVANSRFNKRLGSKLLMGWAIYILALFTVTFTFGWLHPYIMYGLACAGSFAFVFYYGKKQREARRELWSGIEGDKIEGTR